MNVWLTVTEFVLIVALDSLFFVCYVYEFDPALALAFLLSLITRLTFLEFHQAGLSSCSSRARNGAYVKQRLAYCFLSFNFRLDSGFG